MDAQQFEEFKALLQSQAATIQLMQGQVDELTRKNAALEGNVRGSTNTKLTPSTLAPEGSVVLNLSYGRDKLTLNVFEQFRTFLRSAKLSTGTNLTLSMFCDCILVLLDKVSADNLNTCMINYTSANERHAEDSKSTDFKRNGDFENPTFRDELFPRFVRFVVKYLFTEEIQEVVLQNNTLFIVRGDIQNMIPTAIIRQLEEFRRCSAGTRPEKVLSRGSVFTSFKSVMQRGSPRHQQTLSLTLAVLQGTYTEVEHLADGTPNPAAEASHNAKMAAIGRVTDQQYHSISSIPAFTPTAMVHNMSSSLFPDQAQTATLGSNENSSLISLPPLDISNGNSGFAYGLTSLEQPSLPASTIASDFASLSNQVDNVLDRVDQLAGAVHKISLNDLDDEEDSPPVVNVAEVAHDLEADDLFTIATACDLTPACINKIMARSQTTTPADQVTCFFCKEKGHYKVNCPKLNQRRNGGRFRTPTTPYKPSGPDPRRGKPFSSVFGRSNNFNGKKQFTQLKRPNTKFRAYGRFRNAQTGGGYKVNVITTSADLDALPLDAEIFFCDATVEKVHAENRLYFDLA